MDEIAALSQEIEFHEKFRGYDPDEVEAYVDRVRKTAALAVGRITELHQRAEAAEALIAAGRVDSAEETLGRTLLLAQQTADDLVAEARAESERLIAAAEAGSTATVAQADSEAETILRDANERSSRILAEAETDRRDMVRRAESEAEAAASEAHHRLESEVAGLSKARSFLSSDIDILESHLRDQRAKLSVTVSSLQDLVDDPESFRLDPAPATSGVITNVADRSEELQDDDADIVEAPALETLLVEAEPDASEASDAIVEDISEAVDGAVIDLDGAAKFDPRPEGAEVEIEPEPPSPPRLMTAADVDVETSEEVLVDPGPPTAPSPVVAGEPLFAEASSGDLALFTAEVSGLTDGDLLATDSDALSAFFDQDDDDADRSWFGRKR